MPIIPVSILMSIYHKEKPEYFTECMESILSQTFQPDEILLVEDGNLSDELERRIEFYSNKLGSKMTIISLKKNQGLGVALAIGIESCRNELIARMDTDDIMEEKRLELQYKEFQQNPDLTIIGSNIIEFTSNTNQVESKRIVPETDHEIREFSKRRNPFNHMTVMYKKEAVLSVGNYQPLSGFEDYFLWVRLLKAGYCGKNSQLYLVKARAGRDMYARRGGIHYIIPGLKARKKIYNAGLGNRSDYFFVCCVHIFVSLIPNSLREKIYKTFLRK